MGGAYIFEGAKTLTELAGKIEGILDARARDEMYLDDTITIVSREDSAQHVRSQEKLSKSKRSPFLRTYQDLLRRADYQWVAKFHVHS